MKKKEAVWGWAEEKKRRVFDRCVVREGFLPSVLKTLHLACGEDPDEIHNEVNCLLNQPISSGTSLITVICPWNSRVGN